MRWQYFSPYLVKTYKRHTHSCSLPPSPTVPTVYSNHDVQLHSSCCIPCPFVFLCLCPDLKISSICSSFVYIISYLSIKIYLKSTLLYKDSPNLYHQVKMVLWAPIILYIYARMIALSILGFNYKSTFLSVYCELLDDDTCLVHKSISPFRAASGTHCYLLNICKIHYTIKSYMQLQLYSLIRSPLT